MRVRIAPFRAAVYGRRPGRGARTGGGCPAGQPEPTPATLAEALAGRSPVDGGWWAELNPPRTDVVHAAAGGCTASSPTPSGAATGLG